MTRKPSTRLLWQAPSLLCAVCLLAAIHANAADAYDAAVAHAGRSAADLKRDSLDHPADILRAISLPARKTSSVGMLRMLKRAAGAGSSWVFNLAKRNLGSSCCAVAS